LTLISSESSSKGFCASSYKQPAENWSLSKKKDF